MKPAYGVDFRMPPPVGGFIDEPWQYSRLWLLGVNSTTTSNAQSMLVLSRPILSLPFGQYVVLWIGVGILGLALFLGLTLPVYYRRRSPPAYHPRGGS
jgi:hypothetical protein